MSHDASQLVSRAIAAEVTQRLKEASLVIWLDAEDQYTSLVDSLAGKAFGFPYPVVALGTLVREAAGGVAKPKEVEKRGIGSLEQAFVDRLVNEMSTFLLGGRAWMVVSVNHDERLVRVRAAPRGKKPSWGGFLAAVSRFRRLSGDAGGPNFRGGVSVPGRSREGVTHGVARRSG